MHTSAHTQMHTHTHTLWPHPCPESQPYSYSPASSWDSQKEVIECLWGLYVPMSPVPPVALGKQERASGFDATSA